MISKFKISKYTVFVKDNDLFYKSLLQDFLGYKLTIKKIFRSIDDTKVILIETERGPLVLKVFVPKHKKLERFLKSFIKRDYYENLIIQTDRLKAEGISSINDCYLLAEAKIMNYAWAYIMLIEYIEGVELHEYEFIPSEIITEIRLSINELHEHNMVSGDPHRGNFIVTKDGVRMIDLSGKRANAMLKAKDRLDLERHYGITNDIHDAGYYKLKTKRAFRAFLKKIKKSLLLCKKQ